MHTLIIRGDILLMIPYTVIFEFSCLTYVLMLACCRYWQCVAGVKTSAETIERRVSETTSFAMNLFRGQIRPEEVFPFRDGICDIFIGLLTVFKPKLKL